MPTKIEQNKRLWVCPVCGIKILLYSVCGCTEVRCAMCYNEMVHSSVLGDEILYTRKEGLTTTI